MSEFEEGLATGLLLGDGGGGIIVSKTLTQNGTYYAIADAADGYDPVIVAVPIASKSITKNGIYYAADDDLRGFDPVNVNVPMYWTFQPGETVPPSMITPDTHIEEDAPPSSEDVPYPTPEDPDREITPKFRFIGVSTFYREEDHTYFWTYGGEIYDTKTGERLDYVAIAHPKQYENETFSITHWDFNITGGYMTLHVDFRYNWFEPGVTQYDNRQMSVDCGNYTASSDSGQNTPTIYGE